MQPSIHLVFAFLLLPLAAICEAQTTGSITRHVWTGINGTTVSDLTSRPAFPNSPNTSGTLTSFLAPTNWSDNYGTRVFGWVRAPVTGSYTFSIHADDNAELWLGTTLSPDSRRLVASVPEWTNVNEWTKFPSQNSAPISLIAGRFYFIEALHKEGTGGDNLGVAWSYPGQSRIIIPGSALAPWVNLAPVANHDQAVVAQGGLVGIPVLANDLDPNGRTDLNLATLEVITPPAHGTTTVDSNSGQIRYQHNGPAATSDSFVYRIRDAAGLASTAAVSLTVSAAARLAVTTSQMPPAPPELTISLPNAFPGLSFNQPIGIAAPPRETNRVFVIEKGGVIHLIPNLTSPTKATFLDLAGLVNARTAAPAEVFQTSSEQGLLGLAFHPDYAINRRFFVVYSVTVGGTRVQRLSEFLASSTHPNTALPGSERVFIQQVNDAGNHNGGDIHFGPDGYLYMAWGDEGGSNDQYNNAQKINTDFWSSITRIDVDLEAQDHTPSDGTGGDDANRRPNSHPAVVPDANGNPRYEIPADNPWIGATQFLGSAVNPNQVRTEFWAVGLRNPWRMSFDPVTGTLWCADVGQGAREEVNKIVRGGNYEWAFREGFTTGAKWSSRPTGWTGSHPPVYDYTHGSGTFQGRSVTGGFVYRGQNIPSLQGKYIFSDYVSGNLWSLADSTTPPVVERIAGEGGIVSFYPDPSNGDVLLADIDSGMIRRLVSQPIVNTFPQTLADTGLFANPQALVPNPGMHPYDINLPFWSDHALKRRWFGQTSLAQTIGFSAEGNWSLPAGTVWVKHFDIETERGNPATAKRLETRVLVRGGTGTYGVSYRWNEAGTTATLASPAGEEFDLAITDDGSPLTQRWRIPSMSECMTCHSPQAGDSLSFRTRQLNREGTLGSASDNFISLLADTGYLSGLNATPAELDRYISPQETTYSLEERARSYLAVNCAYCHNDAGTAPAAWDASAWLPLFSTGMVNGTLRGPLHPDDRLLVPGHSGRSAILSRAAATNGYSRMPPLGSSVTDPVVIELLTHWINSELPARQSYAMWRVGKLPPGPDGDPGADPDTDGRSNFQEFLAFTDPQRPDTIPTAPPQIGDGTLALQVSALPGRSVIIEHSTDLTDWQRWDVTGNDGLPRPPGAPWLLEATRTKASGFFRTVIRER